MSLSQSFKWSFLSELTAKAIQPLVFLILARFLGPSDFGVMAAALMIISFSQIFWEAGLGKALIQRQTEIEEAANAAFIINLILGAVIASLLFLSAKFFASVFFQDERVTVVLQVMTLQILIGAVSSVQQALLRKEMKFKKLFWVRLGTVGVPALISIPLAFEGMGYWALVAGTLIGELIQAILLWNMSSWRPYFSFDQQTAKEISRFGSWVAVSGLLGWFYLWADSLVVGIYLGSDELGLFRFGNQFSIMIYALLFGPVVPVLYSHLSKMRGDTEKIRRATKVVIQSLTLIAVPSSLFIFSLHEQIADVLFGDSWEGLGLVIGVMSLMHGLSWVVGMNGEVYRAMGRPSYETIVTGLMLIIYLIAYLYSIEYGLQTFLWVRLILGAVTLIVHLIVLWKLLSIDLVSSIFYVIKIFTLTCLILVITHFLVIENIDGVLSQILFGGTISFTIILVALFFLEKENILKNIRWIVQAKAL